MAETINKCTVLKVYMDERDSESSVLVKCGNQNPFLIFDSNNVRPKEGALCALKIEYLGEKPPTIINKKEKKILIKKVNWENNQIVPKIVGAQGEIVKIIQEGAGETELCADIGGLFILASMRGKSAKIGDYLKFGNVDFGSIQR